MFSLHTGRTENPHTPQTHPSASNFYEYHSDILQTPPRQPRGISKEHNIPTDTNRHHQTPQDTERCCLSMSGICPLASVVVCWHGMFPGGARMLVSQSLQYGAKTLFRHSPERHNFCRLTILRHSNIKMVAYKLSKNGWVMPFFL